MSTTSKELSADTRLIKALSHPLRHKILQELNYRVASPSELAKELGEPLGNVAYHVKILAEYDTIEQVRTAPVRGAVEHFYRATVRPWLDDDQWTRVPESVRRAFVADILQDIFDDVVAAAEVDGFKDEKTHVMRTWLDLDDQAYEELFELLNTVVDRAHELHAEAAPRLAKLPRDERNEHRTALMLMHFHRAPGSPQSHRGQSDPSVPGSDHRPES